MKKIYTSILAVASVFVATATTPALQLQQFSAAKTSETIVPAGKTMTTAVSIKPATKYHILADEEQGIAGEYVITLGDYYRGQEESVGLHEEPMTITDNGDGTITFSCSALVTPFTMKYDATTGNITMANFKVGQATTSDGQTVYVRVEPFVYETDATTGQGKVTAKSYTVTFDKETRTIEFPADHGLQWAAFGTSTYLNPLGYFDRQDVISIAPPADPIDEVQEGQWKVVGEATLVDAWITPSYTFNFEDGTSGQIDPAEIPLTCELQQSTTNDKLFRLWRPYSDTEWPIYGANQSAYEGQIVFDITDPAHVVVKAGMPAGFKNKNGDFYVFGMLGYQINGFGADYVEETHLPIILNFMQEKGQAFDTYENNVVTINNSVFDLSPSCSKAYSWQNNAYTVSKINMPADLSAIGVIDNDNANAPVEYFNLQGMKVDNPAAGQIVIRRQGTKVNKIFVK